MQDYGLTDELLFNPLHECRELIQLHNDIAMEQGRATFYGIPREKGVITATYLMSNAQVAVYVVYTNLFDMMKGDSDGRAMA